MPSHKREKFKYNSSLGNSYLKLREERFLSGKTRAITIFYVLNAIEEAAENSNSPISILDIGCSDGSILAHINAALKQNKQKLPISLTGLDFNQDVIDQAKKKFNGISFVCDNIIRKRNIIKNKFDIIIVINTLHEIFSFKALKKRFSFNRGKDAVQKTFKNITSLLKPNGKIFLYDGIEHTLHPNSKVVIELNDFSVVENLLKFSKEYRPVSIKLRKLRKYRYELSIKAFTRFITKYRFLDSMTWELEKNESYQYFNESEFEDLFKMNGIRITSKILLSPHIGEWRALVKILTPDVQFPVENTLFIGEKKR